jgi:hypothetical protein
LDRFSKHRFSKRGEAIINGPTQVYTLGGRVLLILTGLLLLVMPVTEFFWHFDDFLRGGQDWEFGVLLLLTFLGMVLVLSQRRKQKLERMLAVLRWQGFVWRRREQRVRGYLSVSRRTRHGTAAAVSGECLGRYNLPLRI